MPLPPLWVLRGEMPDVHRCELCRSRVRACKTHTDAARAFGVSERQVKSAASNLPPEPLLPEACRDGTCWHDRHWAAVQRVHPEKVHEMMRREFNEPVRRHDLHLLRHGYERRECACSFELLRKEFHKKLDDATRLRFEREDADRRRAWELRHDVPLAHKQEPAYQLFVRTVLREMSDADVCNHAPADAFWCEIRAAWAASEECGRAKSVRGCCC